MQVETSTQEPVDIFAMSDEQFAQFNTGADVSTSVEESASADSSVEEVDIFSSDAAVSDQDAETSADDAIPAEESEEDEFIEVEGADDEIIEDSENNEDTNEPDNDSSDSVNDDTSNKVESEFDADAAFKQLFAEPIKANGKEYNIESVEDARKLMQMGMGFYKNMEALKPKRTLLAMLESNSIDEDKLNFAIDLLNKNPQAINKLIADQDLSEIIDDKNAQYTPNNYRVDERVLNVKEALKEIEETPTYARTVNILGKEWDDASRNIVQEHPHLIATINSHVENGMYDQIIAEVDKRMVFGSIPSGTPLLHAYKMVGDEMYANAGSQTAPAGQQVDKPQANAKPPIRKPSEQVRQSKLATSKPRSTPTPRQVQKVEDVFAMSDEEFNKKYGFK